MDDLKKDSRFAHITKDPRFRPISKAEKKVKIDRRFASMFNDPKFKLKYTVDKRGKPLIKEHTTRDDMKKFYHLEEDDDSETTSSDDEESPEPTKKEKKSLADKELDEILESEDSDDDNENQDDDEEEEEEDDDDDEEQQSSSSEEDDEIPDADDGIEWNEFDDKCTRSEDVSCRLAVCNMDWDRVRATDIFVLLNSWKSPEGVIKSVTVYPSEYGLQQMEVEKKLGPLPGTAKPVTTTELNVADNDQENEAEEEPEVPELKSDDDDDEQPNYNQDDDDDVTDPVMRERLRKYQLNRLKYYYAVVECDTVGTAAKIYEECDGLEYETSAVRLDLRFIPDSVSFDGTTPRDQCTQLPDTKIYKPILFRNTALTQTKVRCTWDETPIERRRLIKKKYTDEELEQLNFDEYLASESEDELQDDDDKLDDDESGDETEKQTNANDNVFKVPTSIPSEENKKKKNQPVIRAPSVLSSQDDIDRYRALLLDFDDSSKTKKKSKSKLPNFFDEQNSDNEDSNDQNGDDDDDDASDIDMEITWQPGLKDKIEQKFNKSDKQAETKKNKKKDKKSKLIKEQLEQYEDDSTENDRETLELLTVDDDIDTKRDFNLREMIKSHKQSIKKGKKTKKTQDNSSNETKSNDNDFHLNVDDKRFQAVFSKPEYNIDQSDPHFKPTAGTQQLIEEKLKKRKFNQITSSSKNSHHDDDDIVIKLKRKSAKKD